MTYHLVRTGAEAPACGAELAPGDQLVSEVEAADPDGRHFNCPQCDKVLHGGRAHVEPPQ